MISCDQHDYIEIVCRFRYPIHLMMKSGVSIEAVALNTALDAQRRECIKVDLQGAECLIVLDDIATLAVRVDNPHFDVVNFS